MQESPCFVSLHSFAAVKKKSKKEKQNKIKQKKQRSSISAHILHAQRQADPLPTSFVTQDLTDVDIMLKEALIPGHTREDSSEPCYLSTLSLQISDQRPLRKIKGRIKNFKGTFLLFLISNSVSYFLNFSLFSKLPLLMAENLAKS